jgi:hypothetical protein
LCCEACSTRPWKASLSGSEKVWSRRLGTSRRMKPKP